MKIALLTATLLITSLFNCVTNAGNSATFKVTQINTNLSLLQGKGGNIVLSKGKDGILIIDNDYPGMSAALKEEIKHAGGVDNLKFILNTHWHKDHTGNNDSLGKGVNIVAHKNVRERLSKQQSIPLLKMVSEPYASHALPNLTYPQSMIIHFNNDTLNLEHYPNGHTDGDSVIFFKKANVVHMGDLFFNPKFPLIDMANGGNAISYAENIGSIIKKINESMLVIPGHGEPTDKKGLIRFQKMLTSTIAEVKTMKTSGLSMKKIQSKGLSKQWESWGKGFINESTWISFIYKSL